MRAIVSVLGKDEPGIIAKVSGVLYEVNANILDITQTVLREEFFVMTMLVDLSAINTSFEEIKQKMQHASEQIGMEIKLQREEIFKSMHRV
ncbi:MAG: ACT domain-containing protein [Christensenellaceae bacterium]